MKIQVTFIGNDFFYFSGNVVWYNVTYGVYDFAIVAYSSKGYYSDEYKWTLTVFRNYAAVYTGNLDNQIVDYQSPLVIDGFVQEGNDGVYVAFKPVKNSFF
jgi:hypothetical protein